MAMSKTAAIKAARAAVGQPVGWGTSWQIHGPYYSTEDGLSGPSTAANAHDYWHAKAVRTRWVASLALSLMGWGAVDAEAATHDADGAVEDVVTAALASGQRWGC